MLIASPCQKVMNTTPDCCLGEIGIEDGSDCKNVVICRMTIYGWTNHNHIFLTFDCQELVEGLAPTNI